MTYFQEPLSLILCLNSALISAFFSRFVLAFAGVFGVCDLLKIDVGLFGEFMTASPLLRMGLTNCRWEFRLFSYAALSADVMDDAHRRWACFFVSQKEGG